MKCLWNWFFHTTKLTLQVTQDSKNWFCHPVWKSYLINNKVNSRDLIAVTDPVILLKLDSNHHFFGPYDLEIWWMTFINNRAPLLCYIKLCASFGSHQWIQTQLTIRKCSIRAKIVDFLSSVTLKSDRCHWKTIECHFCATSSFVHHLMAISELKLELQSGNAQFGSKSATFFLCDLEIWQSSRVIVMWDDIMQ